MASIWPLSISCCRRQVDRPRADVQVMRDLRDRPPRRYQIQDLPPELRWIPPWHNALLGLPDE
jgi:hypothetical protein